MDLQEKETLRWVMTTLGTRRFLIGSRHLKLARLEMLLKLDRAKTFPKEIRRVDLEIGDMTSSVADSMSYLLGESGSRPRANSFRMRHAAWFASPAEVLETSICTSVSEVFVFLATMSLLVVLYLLRRLVFGIRLQGQPVESMHYSSFSAYF